MTLDSPLIDTAALEGRAALLVDAACKAGADAADAVVATSQSLNVDVRLGKVEETDRSESDVYSLRVFIGQRSASVSANLADDPERLAERAVAMARVSPENPHAGLAPGDLLATSARQLDLCDHTVPTVSELESTALECEETALAHKGITNSGGASASWGMAGMVLATSDGFCSNYLASRFSRSISVVAGTADTMERDYDYDSKTHLEDLRPAAEIGDSAAARTLKRLHPRQVETTSAPVIFDPRVANSLAGHLAGAINGAAIARGTSFLHEKLGKAVFSSKINITDDPHIARGQASRPFDGEGVDTGAMILIDEGVLQSWLLDRASASELGLKTNGRARRGDGTLSPGSTNLALQPGEAMPQELVRQAANGLYVTELIGQGVNLVTGDYSRGASGFWIENGELAFPVSGITIAGKLEEMFARLVAANDLVYRYRTNAPTLLVEEMTIAGS